MFSDRIRKSLYSILQSIHIKKGDKSMRSKSDVLFEDIIVDPKKGVQEGLLTQKKDG